jgi:7,8-dihydro-6-hydroxymethylpterin dimethyltransferase
VQTMTYTGQGGGRFAKREHIPVDEAARMVANQSKGALAFSDFLPRPAAHPLCYLTCYMVKVDRTLLPFARLASAERIGALMEDSYLIRLDLDQEFFKDVVQDLYAKGETGHLKTLRAVLEKLYPGKGPVPTAFERQRIAESTVRTIYVHAHMDEDNFDCSRAMLCPDLVPCEPGRLVPACTYNLFYRMQDERFYVRAPQAGKAGEHES